MQDAHAQAQRHKYTHRQSSLSPTNIHTSTHTYTHTCARTHTCTHTHTRTERRLNDTIVHCSKMYCLFTIKNEFKIKRVLSRSFSLAVSLSPPFLPLSVFLYLPHLSLSLSLSFTYIYIYILYASIM